MSRVNTLHGSLIIADVQLNGRGQYERSWQASPSQNLTFSLVFKPSNQHRLTILSLACALAVADVCKRVTKNPFELKWPNDVLFSGKKIGGLLTEAIFNGNVLERVIVGIGININQTVFDGSISESAISLAQITEKRYSRERFLALILTKIEFYYRLWSTKDMDLVKTINKSLIGYGEWARISVNGTDREERCKFLGVNENGALIVLNKALEVDTFSYEQVRIHLD